LWINDRKQIVEGLLITVLPLGKEFGNTTGREVLQGCPCAKETSGKICAPGLPVNDALLRLPGRNSKARDDEDSVVPRWYSWLARREA